MDKIVEMKREIAEKMQALRELVDKVGTRAMTEEEDQQASQMERELEAMKKNLKRMETIKNDMRDFAPPSAPETPAVIMDKKRDISPDINLARCLKVAINAAQGKMSVEEVAKRMYGNDIDLQGTRAMQNTGTGEMGGCLVPENMANEIMPMLRETTLVRQLGATEIPLPNGGIKIPRQTGAANFNWTGEGLPILPSNVKFGMVSMRAKKLTGMIPITNELLKSSEISADAFILNEIVVGMAEAEDITAIYGEGTEYSPKGIIKIAEANKISIGALPDGSNMAKAPAKIIETKLPNKKNLGWLLPGTIWLSLYNLQDTNGNYIHRGEMMQGKYHGYPFRISNNLKTGTDAHGKTTALFGDFSHFLIGGFGGLQIDISTEASYKDGEEMISAYQNDLTLLRGIKQMDFGMRREEAFVILEDIYTK